MTESDQPALSRGALSLKLCLVWLTLALGAVLVVALLIAYDQRGEDGVKAPLVAFAVCWVAGAIALVVTWATRDPQRAINGLLLAMLVRMGLPMAVGISLARRGGPLADAGVFGWIVVFFLVMLAMEAYLSVRLLKQAKQQHKSKAS